MSHLPASRGNTPPPVYNDPAHASTLKPYLTLPYRLSLTWLAYPILSLLFIIFRLNNSSVSAQDAIADARGNLLVGCRAAQQAATSAASMPRFLAASANRQYVEAVNATLNGSRKALILALTCMEGIINFIIDIYRSTLLCFLELAVRGGLSVLISAFQSITDALNSAIGSVRTGIQDQVGNFNSLVKSTVDGLNRIIPFGDPVSVPQLTISSLDSLNNIAVPTTIQDALTKLNETIPSLDELRESIQGIVGTPFELVKKEINDTYANITFDGSLFELPPQNTLAFCDDFETTVIDDLGKDLLKIARIGLGLLCIIALLMLLGNCLIEWWKWRTLKSNMEQTRLAWASDPTVSHVGQYGSTPSLHLSDHNLMVLHSTSEHPLLTRLANKISAWLNLTPAQYINLQFFFSYIFHPPAMACLLIGLFGIITIQMQILALGPLTTKYQAQVAAASSQFSTSISKTVTDTMYNQSAVYADGINGRVAEIQTTINEGVFGWVNVTTTTLNTTITTLYDDIQKVVNQVFGGTILETPAKEFIHCLIGTKVEALENALTFMHDNLRIDLPTMNQTVLVLSPEQVDQVTGPISAAAVGGGDGDQDGGLVGKLIGRYVEQLKSERLMFAIFLLIWLGVVLIAIFIILWHSVIVPYRQRYQKHRHEKEQESYLSSGPFSWPTSSNTDAEANKERSFTPSIQGPSGFWNQVRNQGHAGHSPSSSENSSRIDLRNTKRVSRRLRNLSRKSMGREVLMTDEEARQQLREARYASHEREETHPGWLSRVKSFLPKAKRDNEPDFISPYPLADQSRTHQLGNTSPNRPRLTITTDSASDLQRALPEEDVPGSAWSASPNTEVAPRRYPWMPNRTEPGPTLPAGPRAPLAPFRAFQKPMPEATLSPPLPPVPVTARTTAYTDRPQTSFSLAAPPLSPTSAMTPVTFLLKTTSERNATQSFMNSQQRPPMPTATNPFDSPFDDPPPPPGRKPRESNPFSTPFDDPTSLVKAKAF